MLSKLSEMVISNSLRFMFDIEIEISVKNIQAVLKATVFHWMVYKKRNVKHSHFLIQCKLKLTVFFFIMEYHQFK